MMTLPLSTTTNIALAPHSPILTHACAYRLTFTRAYTDTHTLAHTLTHPSYIHTYIDTYAEYTRITQYTLHYIHILAHYADRCMNKREVLCTHQGHLCGDRDVLGTQMYTQFIYSILRGNTFSVRSLTLSI